MPSGRTVIQTERKVMPKHTSTSDQQPAAATVKPAVPEVPASKEADKEQKPKAAVTAKPKRSSKAKPAVKPKAKPKAKPAVKPKPKPKAVDRLRTEYTAELKAKKTLNKVELLDYIVEFERTEHKLAASAIIKHLRSEGYAISQSRVFDICKDIVRERELDAADALKLKLKPAELKKVKQQEAEIADFEEKMKAMAAEMEARKKALDELKK